MTPPSSSQFKSMAILAIVIFVLFAILIAQFFRIQIVEHQKWTELANRQHFFVVKEPFLRGKFFSNTSIKRGHPESEQAFVIDLQRFHLFIDPESIPKKHRKPVAEFLIKKLDVPAPLSSSFKQQFNRKSRSRKLAMWLDHELRDQLLSWWLPYAKQHKIPRNALYFVTDYQRSYPFGKLLGQLLHTIQFNKDEKTLQAIPTGGLELYFNKTLQGKQGKRLLMRSPRNAFETGEVIAQPVNGADVYLTVNHSLQSIAEEELARGVKKCKAKSGWAVMMNPFTGEILALAQYPFFYPAEYPRFFSDKELIKLTQVQAVTDALEPGSVMKPITLAIALKANDELKKRGEKPLFFPHQKFATSNGRFPGRPKPLKDTRLHNFLNFDMALQKSSNIYVARLAEAIVARLGKDWYRNVLSESFGFGRKTQIELPAESAGLLPTPGKKHPNGTLEWSAATPYSLAMGHNIQVNSIQLLRAYAVFANGGFLVKPTLIRKIIRNSPDGKQEIIIDKTQAKLAENAPLVLSSEIVTQIVNAMKYITKNGGTAPRGNIWGYTEAGKTGTANKISDGHYSENKYCATFIGFCPVKEPQFVLLVTMDEPEYGYVPGIGKQHHGGNNSAPVFREIAARSLEFLGIPPDDPYGYPKGDPRHDSNKADWLKEAQTLQDLYESWNKGAG